MIKFSKKTILIFFVFSLIAPVVSLGQGADFNSVSGLSVVFLEAGQMLTGEKWSSRALDKTVVFDNLSKYDALWGADLLVECNRPAWRYLRQKKRPPIMLHYICGSTAKASRRTSYFDYDYINTFHPEWFLLKDSRNARPQDYRDEDKRIRWKPSDPKHIHYNRFYLDICNRDFQRWASKQILELVSGRTQNLDYSYTGLSMDNVQIGWRHCSAMDNDYPNWKYKKNPEVWNKGYFSYLKTVKKELNKHGCVLAVNHNLNYGLQVDAHYWEVLYESADIIVTERSLRTTGGPHYSGAEWLSCIKRHEEILEKGLVDWWVCYPSGSGKRAQDEFFYTYCSWLLVKKPGRSLYYAMKRKRDNTTDIPWYEAYGLGIGEPTSGRYLSNECWLRDYTNAKIVVNPTKESRKIMLEEARLWLDWNTKRAVTELEVPGRAGRILLPTAYSL